MKNVLLPLVVLIVVLPVRAQAVRHPEPYVHYVYPAGARQGQTLSVDLGGADGIHGARTLLIDGPPGVVVQAIQVVNPYLSRATLAIAPDAPVGRRELRLVGGASGLTNPRPFFVGRLPEVLETEPNDTPDKVAELALPTVVNARVDPTADVDCFAFRGRIGQRFVAAVLAHGMDTLLRGGRLGGFLDARLELLDATGRTLAAAEDSVGLDPVLVHTLPADGRYVVRVQSVSHKGAPSAVYRLTLGDVPVPSHAFPSGGRRGGTVELDVGGHRQRVALPADVSTWHRVPFDHPLTDGRDLPLVCGDEPELVVAESRPRPHAVPLRAPVTVHGRLMHAGEEAWYRLSLKKGQGIVLEVTTQRHLRSTIDSHLRILDATGKLLAENDEGALFAHPNQCAHDFPSTDSWLPFTAPADGDYFVGLSDVGTAAGEQAVYRLAVREAAPDFLLMQWPDAVPVWGPGTTSAFIVQVQHWGGLTADVTLRVEGLPPGWTGSEAVVPASYHGIFPPPYGIQALLTVTAPANAPVGTLAPFRVVGRATLGGRTLERIAQPLALYGPSHTDRMHLRFSGQARAAVAPHLDSWLETSVRELSARVGDTLEIPVRLHRRPGATAEIGIGVDGPINVGAARCSWSPPTPMKAGQNEAKAVVTIGLEVRPGTYGIVVSRAWAADVRAGRPGPCTPILRLTVLPRQP